MFWIWGVGACDSVSASASDSASASEVDSQVESSRLGHVDF